MNLETQKHTKRIEIHQSQITNLDLLNPLKQRSVKMIDGSEERKRQLVFELQSSRVYEKRSNKQTGGFSSSGKALCTSIFHLICIFHTFTI